MDLKIRPYRANEYKMIHDWWAAYAQTDMNAGIPTRDMMPLDSTFVAEADGTPVLCISVYLTNIKEAAYLENFVGHPLFAGPERRKASEALLRYVEDFARARGYKKLFCMAHKDKLVQRYQELGYTPTLSNLTSFIKEL